MTPAMSIKDRRLGPEETVYIIAEMSANHNQDYEQAVKIIEAAKDAGADAVKLQTYTPETMTLDCRNQFFQVQGTIWEGQNLYDLYTKAYTPWEWQPKLKEIAESLGMDLFSTPFDFSSVDFLEKMNVPAFKIASFEVVDLPLLRRVARTGKPIIMSTGMANLGEIDEAVQTIREAGGSQLALLKCTSAYPAPPSEMNLRTIPHMAEAFGVPVGLSDHTLDIATPIAGVALGACIVEKHLTLSRQIQSADSAFSLEPQEFREMVQAIRTAEKALGRVNYGVTKQEISIRNFRRSLFVVEDMQAGETFSEKTVRVIRPGYGLHPRYFEKVIGSKAQKSVVKGTPLSWNLIDDEV